MPHGMFLNVHRLTEAEIVELIDLQAKRLDYWFDKITFPKLGYLRLVEYDQNALSTTSGSAEPEVTVSDTALRRGMELEGVFVTGYNILDVRPGTVYICGFIRKRKWVLGTVVFDEQLKCESIHLEFCPLERIVTLCHPFRILEDMSQVAGGIYHRLKSRASEFETSMKNVWEDCYLATQEMDWRTEEEPRG